ncbi:MAG: 30S ribosomal protein S6 [Magnetococcus sp. DMHC-6]
MAHYETIYIIRPDLTAEQVENVTTRVAELIQTHNGKILQTELWGRRTLAYPIKKNAKGYYVYHVIEGGGPLVKEMESQLKIDEDILKYQNILVHNPKLGATPLAPPDPNNADRANTRGSLDRLGALDEDDIEELDGLNDILVDDGFSYADDLDRDL